MTTDGSGNATFNEDVPGVLQPGQIVTATATDPDGNTSEFSQRIIFATTPGSGPARGRHPRRHQRHALRERRDRDRRGHRRHGVTVDSPTTMHADMPARPAGSLNDVAVTNPSGTGGTLRNGWIADFGDVPSSQQFYFYDHQARRQPDHGRLRRRRLLSAQLGHATADGGLPAEVEERPLLRPAAVHGRVPGRPLLEQLRAVDRGAGGRGDHRRLRRRQLLPGEPRDAPADGGVPAEDEARLVVRAAGVHRRLPRRAVPVDVRRLDRAARGGKHHRRLRRRQLLPGSRPCGATRWRHSSSTRSSFRRLRRRHAGFQCDGQRRRCVLARFSAVARARSASPIRASAGPSGSGVAPASDDPRSRVARSPHKNLGLVQKPR